MICCVYEIIIDVGKCIGGSRMSYESLRQGGFTGWQVTIYFCGFKAHEFYQIIRRTLRYLCFSPVLRLWHGVAASSSNLRVLQWPYCREGLDSAWSSGGAGGLHGNTLPAGRVIGIRRMEEWANYLIMSNMRNSCDSSWWEFRFLVGFLKCANSLKWLNFLQMNKLMSVS